MIAVMIDAEYLFTVAIRDNQVPNYKLIIDTMKTKYPDCEIYVYFVGVKEKKSPVGNFLTKLGVNFVSIFNLPYCKKTQIIGSAIAIDTMRILHTNPHCKFVFMTGDDYLIPLVDYLIKIGNNPDIFYSTLILSQELTKYSCGFNQLTDSFFTFGKRKDGTGPN